MKNKITEKVFVWLCLVTIFMPWSFLTEMKADDAFVVEEEAVIGGEEADMTLPQVQVQTPPQPELPEEAEKPIVKTTKKGEFSSKATQTDEQTEKPETISQNSQAPIFQVPVRRKNEDKNGETIQGEMEDMTFGESVAEETKTLENEEPVQRTEPVAASKHEGPLWLLLVGGVFLIAGIIRILYRLLIRCGKL